MSGVNTVLLSIVTAVMGFLALQVWNLNGTAHEVAQVMTLHTTQITGIQVDVKDAVTNSQKALWASEETGRRIAQIQTKVESIRR